MKLDAKGRFAPPPPLPKHAQRVSESLAQWPDVNARTHWYLGDETVVDGADFYVGDDEIGHLHLDGDAHIAVSKGVRNALVAARLASPFRWSPKFVTFDVASARHVDAALFLFRLAYDGVRGVPEKELLARVAARTDEAGQTTT